jgi:hypothetical protein
MMVMFADFKDARSSTTYIRGKDVAGRGAWTLGLTGSADLFNPKATAHALGSFSALGAMVMIGCDKCPLLKT